MKYYQARLKTHKEDLAAMESLATALAKLGRAQEAVKQYEAALKVAPSRHKIRISLIGELVRQNNLKDAIPHAEELVKRQPGDTDSIRRLGQLILDHGKPDRQSAEKKALETWQKLADARPKDPLAVVQVAEMCRQAAGITSRFGKGRDIGVAKKAADSPLGKAALKFYREGVARSNGAPQYHEYLGEFLYSTNRLEEALVAWRKLAAAPRPRRRRGCASGTGGAASCHDTRRITNQHPRTFASSRSIGRRSVEEESFV